MTDQTPGCGTTSDARKRHAEAIDVAMYQGVEIRPGSRVLISMEGSLTQHAAAQVHERLTARFPDVEFTIINGRVAGVMVPQSLGMADILEMTVRAQVEAAFFAEPEDDQ